MQAKFDSITALTDEFAAQHLNDEYATLMHQATAALCRKRPSPLNSGRDRSWACGISHAIGMVNFLFDPSQSPHVSATDLYAWFGVSNSTGQGKSKQVRDILDMGQLDPEWCLPSLLGDNPLAWMISVNGMILDARSAPPEVQEQLAAAGIIPYVPETIGDTVTSAPPRPKLPKRVIERSGEALYILEVDLVDGPITESFAQTNPRVMRIVLIKGEQSLQDLHQILFEAFDREEAHMYEFAVGGTGPDDPDCQRYGLTASGLEYDGDVAQTTINDLNLEEGEIFGYTFDFGDNWWHVLEVKNVRKKAPKGQEYPKITSREGQSPPQYADFD
ncbi:plasmid pRiA4b ORF-3 family protein [Leptolyngbya iicbica LK]|uniref:Plasmid pRiA4b ORF-3 family protein n=3 Tax=Cyanophyceae TaxID=3028117 RepID=A0A4Q7EB89_9CYAN|nr:plasmid pRiA4b ORF-3 family protein [Leptolyngbya sp. LK]